MKLTYWCATQDADHKCYNIRAKTKKEVLARIEQSGVSEGYYSQPFKVTVEYADAFDLMDQCMGECGMPEFPDN